MAEAGGHDEGRADPNVAIALWVLPVSRRSEPAGHPVEVEAAAGEHPKNRSEAAKSCMREITQDLGRGECRVQGWQIRRRCEGKAVKSKARDDGCPAAKVPDAMNNRRMTLIRHCQDHLASTRRTGSPIRAGAHFEQWRSRPDAARWERHWRSLRSTQTPPFARQLVAQLYSRAIPRTESAPCAGRCWPRVADHAAARKTGGGQRGRPRAPRRDAIGVWLQNIEARPVDHRTGEPRSTRSIPPIIQTSDRRDDASRCGKIAEAPVSKKEDAHGCCIRASSEIVAGWLQGQVMTRRRLRSLVAIILGILGGIVGSWIFGMPRLAGWRPDRLIMVAFRPVISGGIAADN